MRKLFLMTGSVCSLVLAAGSAWGQGAPAGPFHVEQEWKIGGDGFWDYTAVDPQSKLLYITHGNHVAVVDTHTGKQVADITGLHGTHGVVFSTDGVHAYITDGGANQVAEFNRQTNTIEKTIPAGTGPDGAVFDPYTKTVWAFNGRSHDATVIDTTNNTVVATVALPGKPEFPVSDGAGFIYDNIEDKNEIVKLDAKAHTVLATWPVLRQPVGAGDRYCESPAVFGVRRREDGRGRYREWQGRGHARHWRRSGCSGFLAERRLCVQLQWAERHADGGPRGEPGPLQRGAESGDEARSANDGGGS